VEKAAASPTPSSAGVLQKGTGTILLVEDEPPLRVLAAESLKRLGYTVLQAGNGLEALAVADHHPEKIDVVLTDVVMPRMGGPELVEKLRARRSGFAVIFMSGYTDAAALENARIGTGAMLLNKPFSTAVLSKKLQEAQKNASAPSGNSFTARNSG
jgi:two-component system cell cycle sensor histidine kinase/response regulator CckA